MAVPKTVLHLVETFDRNIETYKANQLYNETQLRREFIDPFFEMLGWDVTNKQGYAPAYRDVIHEDAIKIGSETKAPDYCFRIGGARKFFLEAKKPSVDVKGDPHPAYQLRRYAWSAKLPLSILTDFEEFAVYDCQSKPLESDSSSTARIMFLNYKDYPGRWDKIADIFSKDAVLKGSFDKFITSTKTKRGTTTVDIEFLAEIENWRQAFAKTIAHRNTNLTVEQINFAVQKTVDRILFLRMCEDRGIETYGQLLSFINGDNVYPRLCTLFEKADAKYNSGIFHFHKEPDRTEPPDELTLNLSIDDRDLKYIINSLYYPKSPYVFSVLPPEILGNVYEQFLGKVIRLTPARQVKIEEKPEVKKAGGIYYTPSYIVDYIVKNTVGRLLNDPAAITTGADQPFSSRRHGDSSCRSPDTKRSVEPVSESGNPLQSSTAARHCEEAEGRQSNLKPLTPKEIEKIKILDPACGSGSFLLGAYTYLLNYIRDWYVEHNPEKFPKQIYQLRQGQYFLTISEKKKILLNNIFGVDIDTQAVEVTKLSLLLKTLEGETSETVGQTYKMFHERALPDLADNIKCGNSLIGPDFFDDPSIIASEAKQSPSSDNLDELHKRINPFDWQKEFPKIFSRKNPGFDIVIGNPPWGALLTEPELEYLRQKNHEIIVRMIDSFMYFAYQSIRKINSQGFFGVILPDVILYQTDNQKLREFILDCCKIKHILNMGDVFHKVTRPSCILILERGKSPKHIIEVSDFSKVLKTDKVIEIWKKEHFSNLPQDSIRKVPGLLFITSNLANYSIWAKVRSVSHQILQDLVDEDGIQRGVSPDLKEAFLVDSSTAKKYNLEPKKLRKVLTGGKQVKRYFIKHPDLLLIYTNRDDNFRKLPNICTFIDQFKSRITCREVKDHKHPIYSLHRARNEKIFLKKQKLIGVITEDEIILAFDDNMTFVTDGLYLFGTNDLIDNKYLMGILNSKLFVFIYRLLALESGRTLAQVKPTVLAQLPIRTIDFNNPDDKTKHDKMVKLVEQMLNLLKKIAAAKIPDEKTRIQRQIDSTDSQIDNLVYNLYGLTDPEIAVVESQSK